MPATKAVLLNVGVFMADNNVRRSIGAFAYNYSSPTASANTNSFTLLPGQTTTVTNSLMSSSLMYLTCTAPVDVSITALPALSYALSVARVHILDSDVRSVVITNNGASASSVFIVQT